MSDAKNLDTASGYFFVSGFVLARIRQIPIPVISTLLNIISLGLYLLGYLLWFISSHLYSDQLPPNNKWYGFADFGVQNRAAAVIGLIATGFSIAALFCPVLIVPASWLFLISNIVWAISEYHKLNYPPEEDKEYSHSQQQAYFNYALTMAVMGFVAALGTTIAFFCSPTLVLPVLITSSILCIGLGALAAEYWLDLTFGNHKTRLTNESHKQMSRSLGPKEMLELEKSLEPHQGKTIFKKKVLLPQYPNVLITANTCNSVY